MMCFSQPLSVPAGFRLIAATCVVLAGCAREAKGTPRDAEREAGAAATRAETAPSRAVDAAVSALPVAQDVPLIRARRQLMSTLYEITLVSSETPQARSAMEAALDEVARLERELSEWIPESDVSRINAQAGKQPVKVGRDTLENMRASLDAAQRTEGAFDPTWAALRSFYLFQPGQRQVPDLTAVEKRKALVNFRDVVVDEAENTVFLKRKGMAIGLGGIAKGWAVDRASAILIDAGFPNHMVFAGGQVLVRGLRGDRKWRVGIQHPRMQGYIGFLEVSNVSVATAGDYEHSFVAEDGSHWHHILDLRTGLPARLSTSVTLIAKSGLVADALDTGCFVMGAERCLPMLEAYPEPVEAVIIDDQMRMFTTQGTRDKVVMRMPLDSEGRLPRPSR